MENVSVGRIVHFVGSTSNRREVGVCRAAIVVSAKDDDKVGLCVFNPQTVLFKGGVKFDAEKRANSWHFPEPTSPEPPPQANPAEA